MRAAALAMPWRRRRLLCASCISLHEDMDESWQHTVTIEPDLCFDTLLGLRGNITLRSLTLDGYAAALQDERALLDAAADAGVGVLATTRLQRLACSFGCLDNAGLLFVAEHLPLSLEELALTEETENFEHWVVCLRALLPVLRSRCPSLRKLELLHGSSFIGEGDTTPFNRDALGLLASLLSPSTAPACLTHLKLALLQARRADDVDSSLLTEPATALARLLGDNAALVDFSISCLPVQALGAYADALRRNTTLRTLALSFHYDVAHDLAHAMDGLATLTAALSQNTALRIVNIRFKHWCDYELLHSVDDHGVAAGDSLRQLSDAALAAQRALAAHPTCAFDVTVGTWYSYSDW